MRAGRGAGAGEMRGDLARTNLPIPDRPHAGLVTYDAKDPDTSFPPIEPLRPPAGAPNVLIVLHAPVSVRLAAGFHRVIGRISLHLDEPEVFVNALIDWLAANAPTAT